MSRPKHRRTRNEPKPSQLAAALSNRQYYGELGVAKHRAHPGRHGDARLIGRPRHSKHYPPTLWALPG
jgi:hypothetical protein